MSIEEKKPETKEEKIARIEQILKSHGIAMVTGGCGCCGSPYMSFTYKGECIINDDFVCIDS